MPYTPIPREKILEILGRLGPAQPLDIRRETGGDTVLIGAILSEMAAAGLVAISKTKRGGSPFYYLPDRPESLEGLSQFLGEKDRRTYALLREERVLQEVSLEPLTRVSLQNIPDFSRRFLLDSAPYWRYYLVPEEEAVKVVRDRSPPVAAPAAREVPDPEPVAQPVPQENLGVGRVPEPRPADPPKKRSRKRKKEPAQQTFEAVADELYDRVKASLGALTAVEVRKPGADLIGVHAGPGPHGRVHTLVWATTKRVIEKQLLKALLDARGRGMPLLVLAEEMPKRAEGLIEETANVHWRKL